MLDVGIIGGGPGGLFLARLLLLRGIASSVHVSERNSRGATFGFGIVFSDRTMNSIRVADSETYDRILAASRSWRNMELRIGGRALRYDGYGFTAISRQELLDILHGQAVSSGARVDFLTETDVRDVRGSYDVVVAADGVGSSVRDKQRDVFGTEVGRGSAKFIWFGTAAPIKRVTFPFVNTAFGAFAAHAYPYSESLSTFIVETGEKAWRSAGMESSSESADLLGQSDEYSRRLMEEIFSEHLQGHPLLVNNSRWANFRMVRNKVWWHDNVVLLGDAAHTAHFSVGSGTKLALEDAIGLADALGGRYDRGSRRRAAIADGIASAFASYEAVRRPQVARTQRLAATSMRWWESFERRIDMDPERFGFHFLTRTWAIDLAGLRRRHPERIAAAEAAYADRALSGASVTVCDRSPDALAYPFTLGSSVLLNRRIAVVVPASGGVVPCIVQAISTNDLVLADWSDGAWSRSGITQPSWERKGWSEVAAVAYRSGARLGAIIDAEDCARLSDSFASTLSVLVLLFRDAEGLRPDVFGRVTALLPGIDENCLLIFGMECDIDSRAFDSNLLGCAGDAEAAGAAGIYLLPNARSAEPESVLFRDEERWTLIMELADSVRSTSRLPVIVDVGVNWGNGPIELTDGSWSARLHTAFVAGRVDAVAYRYHSISEL